MEMELEEERKRKEEEERRREEEVRRREEERQRREMFNVQDWGESELYRYVKEKYLQQRRYSSISRFEEASAGDGENAQDPNTQARGLHQLHNNLAEDMSYLNPNNEDIYTEIECTYMVSLLKKSSKSFK
mmetsp:Transcript_16618/g.11918  ORF Transcript_16618/g.11918 Transcript_16618/m.11918 type:complete len:130 (+) Transcript_16618:152-541(+)